jgi:hypothetical protein
VVTGNCNLKARLNAYPLKRKLQANLRKMIEIQDEKIKMQGEKVKMQVLQAQLKSGVLALVNNQDSPAPETEASFKKNHVSLSDHPINGPISPGRQIN